MVVNDVLNKNIAFKSDFNQCTLIFKNGNYIELPKARKEEVADDILDAIKSIL